LFRGPAKNLCFVASGTAPSDGHALRELRVAAYQVGEISVMARHASEWA